MRCKCNCVSFPFLSELDYVKFVKGKGDQHTTLHYLSIVKATGGHCRKLQLASFGITD